MESFQKNLPAQARHGTPQIACRRHGMAQILGTVVPGMARHGTARILQKYESFFILTFCEL